MSCDCPEPRDCCQPCPEAPSPVMPRCDIALPDGAFPNATVVVEGGCITGVSAGRVPQYTPAVCCDGGGGGGGDGQPGPPGPPGRAGRDGDSATIAVGRVNTVGSNQPAQVINTGTSTHAVFDFYIPAGPDGEDGSGGFGVDDDTANIVFKDGLLQSLPAAWPPALAFVATANPPNVGMTFSQPATNSGVVTVTLDLESFENGLKSWVEDQIAQAVDPLEDRIVDLEARVATLESKVP